MSMPTEVMNCADAVAMPVCMTANMYSDAAQSATVKSLWLRVSAGHQASPELAASISVQAGDQTAVHGPPASDTLMSVCPDSLLLPTKKRKSLSTTGSGVLCDCCHSVIVSACNALWITYLDR
jgi:hypothetical protein